MASPTGRHILEPSCPRKKTRIARYGVAFIVTSLAMLAAIALDAWSDDATPFPLFLAAVMVSSWYGGLGPGLVAVAVGLPVIMYVFLTPAYSLAVATVTGVQQLTVSLLTALLISWLTARGQRAEERLATLLEQLPVGVGLMDKRGRWTLLNSVMRPYVDQGLDPIHDPGPARRRLRGDADATPLPARWPGERALAGESIEAADILYRSADGAESWIRVSSRPFSDAAGATVGAIVIIQDIDARKRAQDALAASEARYRGLFDASADAILVFDDQGRILDANDAALPLIGPANGRVRRLAVVDQVAPNGHTPDGPDGAAALPRDGQVELVVRCADGELVPVEASSTTVALPNSEVTLSTLRDISRRKRLENAQQEFISSISHDLRTPLTAIRTGVVLLQQHAGERLTPAERQLLTHAQVNSERLGHLIDDLLALNQLEAGALPIDAEPLDLRGPVMSAVAAVYAQIHEKGQTLELDLPEPLPVTGDQKRLEQIVVNLLGNAHQHTPAGTRIGAAGYVDAGDIRLIVRDDGPGIPATEREAVFDRFHRLSDSGSGSGLGLAIARRLAEAHGGRLWAEPAPSGGAQFQLSLPRSEGDPAA